MHNTKYCPFCLFFRLALYVYEYLLHVGAQKSAQTFLSEVCFPILFSLHNFPVCASEINTCWSRINSGDSLEYVYIDQHGFLILWKPVCHVI